MHYNISYKGDNTGRKAINDLIGWFGLGKSKLILRTLRSCHTYGDIDKVDVAISFAGVQGYPVRQLIAYVFGNSKLEIWDSEEQGSKRIINDILYR